MRLQSGPPLRIQGYPVQLTTAGNPVVPTPDGDTIRSSAQNKAERIRLHGIECPERGQAFGTKAKQVTSKLVFGRKVTVKDHGRDRFGCTIGTVLLPDRTNVNHTLVKDGWRWWYRKKARGGTVLEGLDEMGVRWVQDACRTFSSDTMFLSAKQTNRYLGVLVPWGYRGDPVETCRR
ncbi:MAG: thermonuclease family protein [Nitrospiraceae bacterium]